MRAKIWAIPALILGIIIGGWWMASLSDEGDKPAPVTTPDASVEVAKVTPGPESPKPLDAGVKPAPDPEPVPPDAGTPVELVEATPIEPTPKKPKHRRRRTRKRTRTKPDGFLRLDTSPWSTVYLGKRKLGLTPLVGVKLPAGKHRLTAVNDERGLKQTIPVTITPGKTTMLQIKLDK